MKAIYKAPGCMPEAVDIPNRLKDLQSAVGGYIEAVTIAEDAVLLCNEEGRLLRLPHNVRFLGEDFVGPILIVGADNKSGEFTDLSPVGMNLLLRSLRRVCCTVTEGE